MYHIEGTRFLGQGDLLHLSMTQNDELPESQLMIRNVIDHKGNTQLHQRTHICLVLLSIWLQLIGL